MHYIVTSPVQPVSAEASMAYIGVVLTGLGLILLLVLFQSLRARFKLLDDCRKRLRDARREAMFGNWEKALTKMRIVARDCPVSLDNLCLPDDEVRWLRNAASRHMMVIDGRSFYV